MLNSGGQKKRAAETRRRSRSYATSMGRPPCCHKIGIKKGPWTPEEDIILVSYIQEHGPGNWRSVPTNTGNACIPQIALHVFLQIFLLVLSLFLWIAMFLPGSCRPDEMQ